MCQSVISYFYADQTGVGLGLSLRRFVVTGVYMLVLCVFRWEYFSGLTQLVLKLFTHVYYV